MKDRFSTLQKESRAGLSLWFFLFLFFFFEVTVWIESQSPYQLQQHRQVENENLIHSFFSWKKRMGFSNF